MTNSEIYEKILSIKGSDKALKAWTLKDLCILILGNMFTYTGLPDSISEEFIERFLILNGSAAFWKLDNPADELNGELIVSIGGEAERPNVYGVGTSYIASTFNGYVKTLKPHDNGVIGYNNSLHTSDIPFINQIVELMTEILTSLKTNVIYSRLKPIFKVTNDTEKQAVIQAFKNIKDDLEPIQITSRNVMAEELEGQETIKVLDITDVKNADKLQYIMKAADDVIRWFFTYYAGQAIQGNSKLAQQSVDEVQGTTSTSFILPNDRLKMRRKWVEECNKIFGTEITVDFSDAWKTESLKYKAEADINDNGTLEELEEVQEEVTDPDPEAAEPEEPDDEKEEKEGEEK